VAPDIDFVKPSSRELAGVDVFVEAAIPADELGKDLEELTAGSAFALKMIGNRGTMVYPPTGAITDVADHWRCRFVPAPDRGITDEDVLDLLRRVGSRYRWMHVEKLQAFDGEPGFTKDQGEN
jgi:isocitrate dehydrogenase